MASTVSTIHEAAAAAAAEEEANIEKFRRAARFVRDALEGRKPNLGNDRSSKAQVDRTAMEWDYQLQTYVRPRFKYVQDGGEESC